MGRQRDAVDPHLPARGTDDRPRATESALSPSVLPQEPPDLRTWIESVTKAIEQTLNDHGLVDESRMAEVEADIRADLDLYVPRFPLTAALHGQRPSPELKVLIEEAERLLAGTTPGEWERREYAHAATGFGPRRVYRVEIVSPIYIHSRRTGSMVVAVQQDHCDAEQHVADTTFIAASKRLVRQLADALKARP